MRFRPLEELSNQVMDRKVPNTDYYLFKSAKDENLHQS
jgi:hypothetical protein